MTIGIDIGGSTVRGILWNGKKIVRFLSFKIPKKQNIFENKIKKMVENLARKNKVFKIGIGTAGRVEGTKVVRARNIPYFNNFNFKFLIHDSKFTIRVDNDARTYARAEYNIGTGKGARSTSSGQAKSMLVITLGTGIGRAYAKNGKILNIRRFEYAENWEKDYQKIHGKKALAEFLGEKLNILIEVLNPEIVVLGGGVVDKKGYYEEIKKMLKARFLTLGIRQSKLGKFAGAIGAAMLWTREG